MKCANCGVDLESAQCTGESGIYSPTISFELCEPCWLELIEQEGNVQPERLAHYKRTMRINP